MGYGDEIMAAAEARKLRGAGKRVEILDRKGKRRWHPLWEGSDIARLGEVGDFQILVNGPGCRPYVDYAAMKKQFKAVFPDRPFTTKVRDKRLPWLYTKWRATPGELQCIERLKPRGYIVVEPNSKANGCPNKDWGWDRWQLLVYSTKWTVHPWVQLGPKGTRTLDRVARIVTPTFEDACRAVSGAAALVTTDGGLHHAAAALGIPAVVIFGGISSPANLGYDAHINLFQNMGGQSPCGQWVECEHCREAMARIRPDIVADRLEAML